MASLRGVCKSRTICEVLREINDITQGDSEHDKKVRAKISEAVRMAKKMSLKLFEYNKQWDIGWWEKHPEEEKRIKAELRTGSTYKV